MKIKFNVKLKGIDDMKKVSKEMCQQVLMKSMFKMEEIAIQKAPFDRGSLRQRITLFPQVLSNKYVLRSAAPYSFDLEYGNHPRMVKFGDILEWVGRKGIRNSEEDKYAFAKAVVDKIRKEGVNPHPFLRPALYEVKDIWLPIFARESKNSE